MTTEPLFMQTLVAALSATESASHGRETRASAAYHATLRGLLERLK